MTKPEPVRPADARSRPTWIEAWRFFVRQYFHGMDWQYWHPADKERIRNILNS